MNNDSVEGDYGDVAGMHCLFDSLKQVDPLAPQVDRQQRAQRSDDVIRGITGHVSGQGHLGNHKTRLNDTPEGLAILREALEAVEYW